jgi:hypothetical protein
VFCHLTAFVGAMMIGTTTGTLVAPQDVPVTSLRCPRQVGFTDDIVTVKYAAGLVAFASSGGSNNLDRHNLRRCLYLRLGRNYNVSAEWASPDQRCRAALDMWIVRELESASSGELCTNPQCDRFS